MIPKKSTEELEKVPKLPENFEWTEVDLTLAKDMNDVYTLLYENYVEDEDGQFRFNYSQEFLHWALMHPGYKKELFFGISVEKKLVGFISGIVLTVNVEGKSVKATEVNFLCVKKAYRKYYMAAVLIREVVRRSNLMNIWQGIYTSGTMLQTPFAQTRYFHRSLHPEKLIEVKFSYLKPSQKMSTVKKLYQLPEDITLPQGMVLRPAEIKDMKALRALMMKYLSQFKIYVEFSKKDFQHFFVRRENILESFVIETNGKITEFFSFYCLPSSVLNHPKYKEIKAAYSYYFVNNNMSIEDLYHVALIKAKQLDYDVFNALDIMNNEKVFERHLFASGDGFLQYYMYNWKIKSTVLTPNEIGMVLM